MLQIGNKPISNEYLQTRNLAYDNVARVMLEETNRILADKNKDRIFSFFKENVWATHANFNNSQLQYGTEMLESIITNRPKCDFYYCTVMENGELLCITVPCGKATMISKATRCSSVLFEEVAHHLVGGLHGHDSVFITKFVEIWREYFTSIRGKIEIEITSLEE